MNRVPWLAYGLAILNATIIGLSFMFTKIAVNTCPAMNTLMFRFLIGATVLLAYVRVAKVPLHFRGKPWLRLVPIILFYPIGFFTFQAFGLQCRISSSEAGILTASAPILTAILAAVFIREKTNFLQCLSIAVSIFGVLYISWSKGDTIDPSNMAGIILILLSCLSSAGYTVCNRVLVRSFTAGEISLVLMLSGALFFSGGAMIESFHQGISFQEFLAPLKSPIFLVSIFYLGIFASLLTTLLASLILKRISSSQLVIFFNLATVVSIIAGYCFLQEPIHTYHIIGTVIIIAGVIGTNYFKDKERR